MRTKPFWTTWRSKTGRTSNVLSTLLCKRGLGRSQTLDLRSLSDVSIWICVWCFLLMLWLWWIYNRQTDRQTTVQLQQLKVSHVIGNVKCWIGPVLRNGRVYRLLTGQTRVNSGKQAPAKKVPLSDISITVQFNLKKTTVWCHILIWCNIGY